MKEPMKNISKSEVVTLKNEVNYQDGQVVARHSLRTMLLVLRYSLLIKNEEISTHNLAEMHL